MFVPFLILTQFSIISLMIYLFIYIIHVFISLTLPLIQLLNFAYNNEKSLLNSISNLIIINKPLTYLLFINFFSLAGLPPLGGFFAKFYIFIALFEVNMFTILILFIVISCFSSYYYLNIIIHTTTNSKAATPIKPRIGDMQLPFSYCTVLTLITYIIVGFVFLNHLFIELDFLNFELN